VGKIKEGLTGGLVTIKDPADLQRGELSDLRNAVYSAGYDGLLRARGRDVFGVVSATAVDVVGLRDIHFDNGDHYLIAGASTNYYRAPVGDTGNFTLVESTVGSFTTLDRVHYRNRFFLLNGATTGEGATATLPNSNRTYYLSATSAGTTLQARQHGMLPVVAAPAVSSTAGVFSQTVTGYYEYWTTEVAKLTQDGAEIVLESTFASDTNPTTVFVSATSVVPQIFMPTLRNAITTHWRIYRSPKKDKESDKKFPTGFMISEVGTATSMVPDTLTTASASSLPTTFNNSGFYFDYANASRMGTDDGNYASATVPGILTPVQQAAYGFNLGGFSGSVKGIQVEFQAYISGGTGPVPVNVTIGKRATNGNFTTIIGGALGQLAGPFNTASKSIIVTGTNSGSPQTVTVGTASDRWFASDKPGLTDSDFGPNFMLVLSVSKPSVSMGFDYVKAIVYYAATVESVVPFPTVVYTFGDIAAQVGKNGPPPSSNTGDLFEDSLVVNDITNPALVRYSYPGDPEAFPATYFIDFETADNDQVRAIKVVNSRLVVGLDTSLWRVNYLPSERDASFDRGKAIEAISRQYGCVNPMCCCVFTADGSREEFAFVSHKGIFSTDGFDCNLRSGKLDWRLVIPITATATPIALVNNPEEQRLEFYYRNDANGNETYLRLDFSYAKGDVDAEGNFRVGGPVHMRNFDVGTSGRADLKSAWALPRSSGDTGIYLGYGGAATAAGAGKVYREQGSTIPAQDATMGYTTREMYLGEEGGEFRLDALYAQLGTYSGTPALTYTPKTVKTDDGNGLVTQGAKSKTLAGQKQAQFHFSQIAEGMRITMSSSGQVDQKHRGLILEGTNFGDQDSGL
jgi:hypothetical protein